MYTIEAVDKLLDEVAQELPAELFSQLNGGVILLEECKYHPEGAGDLYILGEYRSQRQMGRCVCIFYGSLMRAFGWAPEEVLRRELRRLLLHELTHHLESLAGEWGLAVKDQAQLEEYKRTHQDLNE